jgi:hypothetical protein
MTEKQFYFLCLLLCVVACYLLRDLSTGCGDAKRITGRFFG